MAKLSSADPTLQEVIGPSATTDQDLSPGKYYLSVAELGTSFLGISVNHTITETIAVGLPPVLLVVLGFQAVT